MRSRVEADLRGFTRHCPILAPLCARVRCSGDKEKVSHEAPQPMAKFLPLRDTYSVAAPRERRAFRNFMLSSTVDKIVSDGFPNQCKNRYCLLKPNVMSDLDIEQDFVFLHA